MQISLATMLCPEILIFEMGPVAGLYGACITPLCVFLRPVGRHGVISG